MQTPIRIGGLTENNDIIMMLSQAIHDYQSNTEQQILLPPASNKSFINLLMDNKIDIAICHHTPQGDNNPELACRELFKANMLAFVESTHRLAGRSSISLNDLKDELFVHLTSTYAESGWSTIIEACKAHGFTPHSYPVDEQGIASCFIQPLGDSILVLQEGVMSSNLLALNRYVCLPIEGDDVHFTNCAYYRKADEDRLLPLLRCLANCTSAELDADIAHEEQIDATYLKAACAKVAKLYELTENELTAMANFVQGTPIDSLCEKFKMSRIEVGDMLASVYAKVGVSDRQSLIEFIHSDTK